MRRAGFGKDGPNTESGPNTTANSMAPSKAGSETGDDSQRGTGVVSPTDSVAAKDKASMTREEREAKYKETRERIFKGFEDSENAETTDANGALNEVSRTSSVNEKKKAKKQRNRDDDFEARSKFNAYYPSIQYPVSTYDQANNPATFYHPYGPQHHVTISQPGPLGAGMIHQTYSQQGYQNVPNSAAFPMPMQQMPLMNGISYTAQNAGSPPFPNYSQPAQYFQPIQPQIPMGPHTPAMSSPSLSNNVQLARPQPQITDQRWPQNNFTYVYQRPREQQQYYSGPMLDQPPAPTMHSIPYQYGQLPYQPNVQGGRTQHPLPGSYPGSLPRQNLNPQTRAFVPGSGNIPSAISLGGRSNESNARGPGTAFANGNQIAPYTQQPESGSQIPSAPTSGSLNQTQDPKSYGTRRTTLHGSGPHSPVPVPNSLSKWGTPAHLPPKPPPPEIPSMPEVQHSLPSNVHASMNVQPITNGQPMPSFQNGVYSMPAAGAQ